MVFRRVEFDDEVFVKADSLGAVGGSIMRLPLIDLRSGGLGTPPADDLSPGGLPYLLLYDAHADRLRAGRSGET